MPVFLRKYVSAGPFRFNLSKSGIGVSAGVPGFRVGLIGPRGQYVYAGREGIYYRKTLSSKPGLGAAGATNTPALLPSPPSQPVLQETVGATVLEMATAAPSDLISQLTHAAQTPSLWGWTALLGAVLAAIALGLFWPAGIVVLAFAVIGIWWMRQRDQVRKTVVTFYDVQDQYAERFEKFTETFQSLTATRRLSRVVAAGATTSNYQRKVSAGASEIDKLQAVTMNLDGPKQLATNVAVPSLADSKRAFHFLPDRILIREGNAFADVDYGQLIATSGSVRWIEEGSSPADAPQVGVTWKYVNKSGGPDRRFRNNRQLPILQFSSLHMTAPNGLDALYHLSNPQAAELLVSALESMKRLAAG